MSTSPLFTISALYYSLPEGKGPSKRQLFGNFLAFSESSHQTEPENACGARKTKKVGKWVTLVLVPFSGTEMLCF